MLEPQNMPPSLPPTLKTSAPVPPRRSLIQWLTVLGIFIGVGGAVLLWYLPKTQGQGGDNSSSTELVVIQLNDTYRVDALRNGEDGGLGRVATLIKQTLQQHENVIVVHAGDFIAPSLESNLFQGQQMISALNYLDGLAPVYVVPGNHEFDQSSATMVVNAIQSSNFPWLASNLTLTNDNGKSLTVDDQAACATDGESNGQVAKCAMVQAGTLKVGIFALTLHGAQSGGGDQKYAQVATEERYQLSDDALSQLSSEIPREILQALTPLKDQVFNNRDDFLKAAKSAVSESNKSFWTQIENKNEFWLAIKDDKEAWNQPNAKAQFLVSLQDSEEFWSSIADSASQVYVGPAERAIQRLEQAGADVIIGLTHLDMMDDKQIARLRRTHPRFVWIAGGHEHYAQREGLSPASALITKGDSNARSVWKVAIGRQGNTFRVAEEKIEVNKDTLASDPLYDQLIAANYQAKLREKMEYLGDAIGSVQDVRTDDRCFHATEEVVRNKKSDWGTYLAGAMRHAYPQQEAQIGIMNGGGIRIDDDFCDSITYEQLERSIGFPTKVVYVKLKGSAIVAMLEHSVGGKRGEGSFLQVSGLRFDYDRKKIPGWRTSNIQVQTKGGWTPLKPDQEYSLATSEFLFNCRDGYVFRNEVTSYIPPGPDLRKLVVDSFKVVRTGKAQTIPPEGVFELPSFATTARAGKVDWQPFSDQKCPQ